jgi:hypothetical protein
MAGAQLETQNLLAHSRLTSHKTNYREDLAVARGLLPSSCTEIAKRLPGAVTDDEARVVRLIDRPRRREATSGAHKPMIASFTRASAITGLALTSL